MAGLLGPARHGGGPACARAACRRCSKRGGGVILNNASICAAQPLWYEPIYNVTKAALMMFSKTLATEFVKDNIRVNCINAGLRADPRLDQDGEAAHRRQGRRLAGLSRQAVADEHAPIKRFATPAGDGGLLRLPVLRQGELFGRLDLFRRRRDAEDGDVERGTRSQLALATAPKAGGHETRAAGTLPPPMSPAWRASRSRRCRAPSPRARASRRRPAARSSRRRRSSATARTSFRASS